MDAAHRKIELQSPDDLKYLIANVSRVARSKIDLHLPPNAAPEGEDAFRRQVELLVQEYIQNVFSLAKPNLEINGLSAEVSQPSQEPEEYEPYNTHLATKLSSLSSTIENSITQTSALRRTGPVTSSQNFRTHFSAQLEASTALTEAQEAAVKKRYAEEITAGGLGMGLVVPDILRAREVQDTWESGLEGLERMKSTLPGTVARLERAKKAAEVIEGM